MQDYLDAHCAVQYCQPRGVLAAWKIALQRGRKCIMFGDIWPWRDWIWGTPARNPAGATGREQSRAGEEGERLGWTSTITLNRRSATCGRLTGWRPPQNFLKVPKKKGRMQHVLSRYAWETKLSHFEYSSLIIRDAVAIGKLLTLLRMCCLHVQGLEVSLGTARP